LTDPDPITAIAGQLEELRRQLAVYTGETGHLRARQEQDSGQVLMLRLEIKQLGQKLAEAIARRQTTDPPAPYWLGLSREEHAARLAEVRGWVEKVARVQWPGYMARLPPCWANHPEAVWELGNLAAEWGRVYGDPDNRPLQDALWFYERWLPGVLSRLAAAIRCDVAGCLGTAQHPAQRAPPPPQLSLTVPSKVPACVRAPWPSAYAPAARQCRDNCAFASKRHCTNAPSEPARCTAPDRAKALLEMRCSMSARLARAEARG
jgi:hypothetical protein